MTAVALLPEIPQLTMYNMGDDDGKMANIKRSPFDGESTEAEKKTHRKICDSGLVRESYCYILLSHYYYHSTHKYGMHAIYTYPIYACVMKM